MSARDLLRFAYGDLNHLYYKVTPNYQVFPRNTKGFSNTNLKLCAVATTGRPQYLLCFLVGIYCS